MDFRLLGSLEVTHDGEVVRLAKRQQRAVLTLLLLRAGGLVSTDNLVDALWPDDPPAGARESLHSHIARVRRALEPGRAAGEPSTRLLTEPPGYRLVVEPGEVDIGRFEAMAADGRAALVAGQHRDAAELLRAALGEWRGPALAEFHDDAFAEPEARRLDAARIDVLEARIDADLHLGRTDMVGELEALVAEHPLRERLWEQLLTALYRARRQTEALRRAQEVRRLLAESGLEPGASLRAIEAGIIAQDPDLAQPPGRAPAAPGVPEPPAGSFAAVRLPVPRPWAPHDLQLVGRRAELARFEQLWEDGADGSPALLLLGGEPGIGKTRLAFELARRADGHGALVLAGRCSPHPLLPHEPIVAALTQLVGAAPDTALASLGRHGPHLARLLPDVEDRFATVPDAAEDPGLARYRAYQAVTQLLRVAGEQRRILLVADDLQWAEPATLHLITHLLHADLPGLVVLGTVRSTEVDDHHPLRTAIDQLSRDLPVVELAVEGLSETEVSELIHRSHGSQPSAPMAAAVHAGTAGNPLFVREVVRTVDGTWRPGEALRFPDSVRSLVLRRLDLLQPAARELLEAAAVIDRRVDPALLAAVLGRPRGELADDLDLAVRAGLLTRRPDGVEVFTHEVTRNAIELTLGPARAAALHRRTGEALLVQSRDHEPPLDRLAGHFANAALDGDATRAIEFAERAGHQALALLAYEDAATRFQDGLDVLDRTGAVDEAARLRLIIGRQIGQRRAGHIPSDLHLGLDALALARAIGSPEQVAQAAIGLSAAAWRETDSGQVVADALTAALPDAARDPHAEVEVLAELATVVAALGQHGLCVDLCRRIQALAPAVTDDVTYVNAVCTTVNLLVNEDPLAERLALVASCRERADRSGSPEARAVALACTRYLMWEGLDILGARAAGAAYEELVEELRMPRYLAGRAQRRAALALLRGEFDEAEAQAQEMLALQPHREFLEGFVAQLFAIRAEQGRLDEVLAMIDELGAGELMEWRGAKALCLVEQGQLDAARDHLAPFLDAAPRFPRHALWLASTFVAASAAARIGDPAGAAELYRLLEPEADRAVVLGTGAVCFGVVAGVLGPLALAMGDVDGAVRWCRESLAAHSQVDAVPFQVADRLWLAKALAARAGPGDVEEAEALAAAAVVDADRLGMGGQVVDAARRHELP